MTNLKAILVSLILSISSFAAIQVDVRASSGFWTDETKQRLESAIAQGTWDDKQIKFPLEGKQAALNSLGDALAMENGKPFVKVTSKTFSALPANVKEHVMGNMLTYWDNGYAFDAWVGTKDNDLKSEPAMIRLDVPFDSLAESVWAQELLSSFAKTWAKKWSTFSGPNCYHSSMASIFKGWDKPRYMRPEELICHQRTHFEPIEKPERWGDMISFDDSKNVPIHAFTYLGPTRNNPTQPIVFTKNGYAVSQYLFMTYNGVYGVYSGYGIQHIRYYRPKQIAIDPATDSTAPCYREYAGGTWSKIPQVKDAVFETGLKRKPPETFKPIVVE